MSLASKQMVFELSNHIKENNGFELLNHVSRKQAKRIFSKIGLTKIPSSKQAYRSEVFRTCTVVLGYHTFILVLPGRQT